MKNLNKEEMLLALAEIAVNVEAELDYKNNSVENNFKLLSLCEDLSSYEVNKLYARTEDYISDVIENTYEQATDNDAIQIIFRITRIKDKEIGYLEYSGRYSSWDNSEYYDRYVVEPREVTVVQYNRIKVE